jgi:hypothetical protein
MKTTDLFAEIIVIGVGTLAAVVLFLLSIEPRFAAIMRIGSAIALVPALAVAYLLGIITDRTADKMSSAIAHRRRDEADKEFSEDWQTRHYAALRNVSRVAEDALYARSRLRVVRGWFLNSILLGAATTTYLARQSCTACGLRSAVIAGVGFGILALACYLVWDAFDKAEVEVIGRHSERRTPMP